MTMAAQLLRIDRITSHLRQWQRSARGPPIILELNFRIKFTFKTYMSFYFS